ncbi:MAG: S1 RNA-binding domain-containing protein [Anaerolineae bacterium]
MANQFHDQHDEDPQDFASLLDAYYDEFEDLDRGDIVPDAEILQIRPTEIIVALPHSKRDGIIPLSDIERMEPGVFESLRVGDQVAVYVLNPSDKDGNLLVSLNLGMQARDWARASELLESGELAECTIIGSNAGGVLVQFGSMEGFVPNSHMLDVPQGLAGEQRRAAIEKLIGTTVGLKVIEVNQRRRRLILSQREAQKEWRQQQKSRLMQELKVGDVVRGTVTGIRDFGVFVNLGGADGLIHVSELAWHRVPHPSDVVALGDEIDVYVMELDEENQRIALSRRRTMPDPWDVVLETYQIGQIVEGKVSNVVDFGAFVVLPDGIEGLLHVTEMGDGSLTEPYSYMKRGDTVRMRIVAIEPERKRIGFTQKDLPLDRPIEVEPARRVAAQPSEDGEQTMSLPQDARAEDDTSESAA